MRKAFYELLLEMYTFNIALLHLHLHLPLLPYVM